MTDRTAAQRPRLAPRDMPDVSRPVRLHGSLARAEVGGGACFGVAVALATR